MSDWVNVTDVERKRWGDLAVLTLLLAMQPYLSFGYLSLSLEWPSVSVSMWEKAGYAEVKQIN